MINLIYDLGTYTRLLLLYIFFFFNDTATTEIYTLSLHDALPISAPAKKANTASGLAAAISVSRAWNSTLGKGTVSCLLTDRKSTRLNSSHGYISYAVFCLKKKNRITIHHTTVQ